MIELRPARLEELPELSALCLRSKGHWGYDQDFLDQCRDALTVRPEHMPTLRVAEHDGQAVGVVRVTVSGQDAELSKLFVAPEAIGHGYGAHLMRWAMDAARAQGARVLRIESDPGAEPFYLRFGAVRVGEVPSEAIAGRSLPLLHLDL